MSGKEASWLLTESVPADLPRKKNKPSVVSIPHPTWPISTSHCKIGWRDDKLCPTVFQLLIIFTIWTSNSAKYLTGTNLEFLNFPVVLFVFAPFSHRSVIKAPNTENWYFVFHDKFSVTQKATSLLRFNTYSWIRCYVFHFGEVVKLEKRGTSLSQIYSIVCVCV